MPKKRPGLGDLEKTASAIAEEMGYRLVELALAREAEGLFLRFTVDKPGGISLDDCEAYHRRVQPLTDAVDFDYMEVSSPGADRPLKSPEDFARAEGTAVEVRLYKARGGAKRFTGILQALVGDAFTIRDEAGNDVSFTLQETAVVRPLIEFTEEDLADDTEFTGGMES